jgi:hypothetical protein
MLVSMAVGVLCIEAYHLVGATLLRLMRLTAMA